MFDLSLQPQVVLCYKVCPDLFRGPFYVMRRPDSMPSPHNVGAYADLHYLATAPSLRDELIEQNCWRGYGPAIVFCSDGPTEGLTLHELGHLMPLRETYPDDCEPDQNSRKWESKALKLWASGEIEIIDKSEPWRMHEAPWIRYTLHLWWRAVNQHGYKIHPSTISVAGERYGLSHGQKYLKALGDEPERLSELSFNEIAGIEGPHEFTELFAADCAAYELRRDLETCKAH